MTDDDIDPYEKAEALIDAARGLKATNIQEFMTTLGKAEDDAVQCSDDWQKAELLSKIGVEFLNAGCAEQALRVWERAIVIAREGEKSISDQDSFDSASVLGEIAVNLFNAGFTKEAVAAATEIAHEYIRKRTFNLLGDPME
jgi:hypothetical protein